MNMLQRIDSSFPIEKIMPFCKQAINDNRPGAENMRPTNWETNKSSFLYLLYIEKRYDGTGNGYVIHSRDNTIVCGSGFSVSDIDEKFTHLSSRSYTIPGIRLPRVQGAMHDYAIDISKAEGRYGAFTSFNEYNKRFVDGYIHINDPKNHKGYFYQDGNHYAKPGVRIHPMEIAGPLIVKGTKQWIVYMIWNEAHRSTFLEALEPIKWVE